jgi:hypothetical protein
MSPTTTTKILARRRIESGPKFEGLILRYAEIDVL